MGRIFDKLADLVGADPYPAEEPQAAADREREQPRPDYTHDTFEPEPEEYVWTMNGTHISVHHADKTDHASLFDLMGHSDFSRPHAFGKLYLHSRWDTLWEVEASNMGLHLVEKRLKKYAKDMGWKYGGLMDEHGSPMEGLGLGKIAAVGGITLKSWQGPKEEEAWTDWTGDDMTAGWPAHYINAYDAHGDGVGSMVWEPSTFHEDGQGVILHSVWVDPKYRNSEVFLTMWNQFKKDSGGQPVNATFDDPRLQQVVRRYNESMGYQHHPPEPGDTEEKTLRVMASVPGIGEINPGLKDWRRQHGDLELGNMGGEGDTPQIDYYGITDGEGDTMAPGDPRLCSECGYPAMDYADWRDHTLRAHVNPHRQPNPIPSPVVDLDDVLPAGFNNSTMDKTVQRQSRLIFQFAQNEKTAAGPVIAGPIPFIYDVEADRIFVGHPGERHADIQGRFTPGGIVEGVYDPKGGVQIRTDTDMPYTVRHMIQLWYAMHPELEVKNVYLLVGEKRVKLASANIGHRVRNLAATDPAAWAAYVALRPLGNVYVVGGAVRDVVLGKIPKDVDLMVQGINYDELEETLSKLPGRLIRPGEGSYKDTPGELEFYRKKFPDEDVPNVDQVHAFPVYRYRDPEGNEVEIAIPREEISTGEGHHDFMVKADPFLPPEKDLARRDFTGNAMAVNLDTGELIDPHNGVQDLKQGRLHSHNERVFEEDPLRILRALSSVSRHGLDPSPELYEAMRQNAYRLNSVPPERVGDEMDKILSGDDPAKAIELAAATGVLAVVFPDLQATVGFDQKNKHHSLLLFDHLMQVLRRTAELTPDLNTRWAALLHDVGKPASYWEDDEGNGHYYHNEEVGKGQQHELVGADMTRKIMEGVRRPNDQINDVAHMVRWHMFAPFHSAGGARRFINRIGPQHAENMLHLREADSGGKGHDGDPVILQRQLVRQVFESREPTDRSALAINGKDLIDAGIQPGPEMGTILNALTEAVLDDPSLNERETLLQMALAMPPGGPELPPNATVGRRQGNILDPLQESLDPKVFDRPDSATPDVKEAIIRWMHDLVHGAIKDAGWPDPADWLTMTLTGSLTTYQWSEHSDFDTSFWVDVERFPEYIRGELFKITREAVDGQIVPGTTHPVQGFWMGRTQVMEDQFRPGVRSGYNLETREWIVAPEPQRSVDVSQAYPAELAYAAMCYDKMVMLLKYDVDGARQYFKLIQHLRRNDMAKGKGDFARSNIVYKYMANRGIIEAYMDVTGEYVAH